jgi:small GTP-binding protein
VNAEPPAAPHADCRAIRVTPSGSGAVAILQLVGKCAPILEQITGKTDWTVGQMRLSNLAGIDDGLAVMLSDRISQLMPHGGPRVMQRLIAHLQEIGVQMASENDEDLDPMDLYPEAHDEIEALTLCALARAESPLAIELLLDQPSRWRKLRERNLSLTESDRQRSSRLNRLITPSTVVLCGLPNVGKSTLSNALLGRSMSIALDQPGTTRDYTVGRIDLGGLVVNWHDTPGIRQSEDSIETKAIDIARRLIAGCDLLIAMTDAQSMELPDVPREPDLFVINKCDLLDSPAHKPLLTTDGRKTRIAPDRAAIRISAQTGDGIPALVTAIRDRLVSPSDLAHGGAWEFDRRLPMPAIS